VHARQGLGSRFRIRYRGIDRFDVPISSLEANFLFARDSGTNPFRYMQSECPRKSCDRLSVKQNRQ